MINHSWRDLPEVEIYTKPQECRKCRVIRKWHGGDYQAWEYITIRPFVAENGTNQHEIIRSWDRPDCIKIKP